MFLFYKSMVCAVYLQQLIIFTIILHIVCISHYKSIKSIDDNVYKKTVDAKYKKIASCLPVILLTINGYGITVTTITVLQNQRLI